MRDGTTFIAEVSSNHHGSLERCLCFVEAAAELGCDAVKFQLFQIESLFTPEVLEKSARHRERRKWELPDDFLPHIAAHCRKHSIQFACTPFYLDAVGQLFPYVDFYKVSSYELLWDDLLAACATTGKPVVLSTGMADLGEVTRAVAVLRRFGCQDLTLLHCVSGYPTPVEDCNLAAIATLRDRFGGPVGWSDHSTSPAVIHRAVNRWGASTVEFHLDLEGEGAEYPSGHCWLPREIAPVIQDVRLGLTADGQSEKEPVAAELDERSWRADPSDGLRPRLSLRSRPTAGPENVPAATAETHRHTSGERM